MSNQKGSIAGVILIVVAVIIGWFAISNLNKGPEVELTTEQQEARVEEVRDEVSNKLVNIKASLDVANNSNLDEAVKILNELSVSLNEYSKEVEGEYRKEIKDLKKEIDKLEAQIRLSIEDTNLEDLDVLFEEIIDEIEEIIIEDVIETETEVTTEEDITDEEAVMDEETTDLNN